VARFIVMTISARDRKRLWGKSGGRCALCGRPLIHVGHNQGAETVIGEEAHIIGERPGAARHLVLAATERDAYENRILLCPTDHVLVDGQAEHWTVARLRAIKDAHERTMTARTADVRRDGVDFDMPEAVVLGPVIGGGRLLNIVGPAQAYVFECDELEGPSEHEAAGALLGDAHDLGEIYSMLSPAEQIEASQGLSQRLLEGIEAGVMLRGERIDVDVAGPGWRDRWPVAILHLRRALVVAAEQAAARDAEQALRDGGIEGLGVWAEAAARERPT
jgi:hypothetical protein